MREKKIIRNLFVGGGILLVPAGVLQFAARKIPGFGQWYAVTIYPWIVGIYGRICGLVPFSVVEMGLYGLVLFFVYSLLRRERKWRKIFAGVFFTAGLLAFLYTANCGVNYYRKPFSSYLDLQMGKATTEDLKALCQELVEKINETAPEGPVDMGLLVQGKLARTGKAAMEKLGEEYPALSGCYPVPKPVMVSWILAVQQLCGVYSPFTVEANYNWQMTGYNIPHTICHELSHLRGFMREDEANFIGILACTESDDAYFRYSGYLMAWVHAGNALAKADVESFYELHSQLCGQAVQDLQENNEYWDQYEGKVAEVSNQVNDTYLKLNDQKDGVQSYGRVVDLMLAMFLQNRQEAQ